MDKTEKKIVQYLNEAHAKEKTLTRSRQDAV
jgi:hypothetical protein